MEETDTKNAQPTTGRPTGNRSVDVTGLSEGAIRALEVLVSELRGQRELRREVGIGIEHADRGQMAPLSAKETLARVRKERQASSGP